jgi:phage terminase large subunit-like protein
VSVAESAGQAARESVADWAESTWVLPETRRPIVLKPWQRSVLDAIFPPDGSPTQHETFLISAPKKAGKTTLNAIATLRSALTAPPGTTVFCVANDLAQAQERVFDLIAKQLRPTAARNPELLTITKSEIVIPNASTRIVALPADFAGAAGAIFGVTSWTELWSFRFEGHVRLWEELTPIPGLGSLRIVDSYAGFSGDSPILEPMWTRALAGERLDDELPIYANGRLWAYLDTGEEAQRRCWLPPQDQFDSYYAEQRETLRPGTFARLHLNQWQSGEEAFVTGEEWDSCVDPAARPLISAPKLRLSVGVDAATKGDAAAVVAVAHDGQRVRLVQHRIWRPRKNDPLDLEDTIESYLLALRRDFRIAAVLYDPYQMARSASTLRKAGLPMVEYPQTVGNLTASSQALFDAIRSRALGVYPDEELRRHVLAATAVETARGWRLAKEKSSRKIDGAVALSFAVLDAVEHHRAPSEFMPQVHDEGSGDGIAAAFPRRIRDGMVGSDVDLGLDYGSGF